MVPSNPQEWIAIASERASDAEEIFKGKPNSVGSVYMAGYAIECSLKAYYKKQGKQPPTSGRRGHNLKTMLKDCGHRLSDLRDGDGYKSFYLDSWSTDLRYETKLPVGFEDKAEELLKAARKLTGNIQTWLRRERKQK